MEELAKKVEKILTVFLQEELGNRLSQFAIKGLKDTLVTEIMNYKIVKSEVKEDVKK